jgi:beta-1,4-mannosyl-glycoprotein beta-1,4-N-acetylglucosaminyltransferase
MKIIDTTTFFEEEMMMDIRFNILNQYVDYFVVCEALFTHRGDKKKINFDISKYPKFKHKIIHLILEKEPDDLIKNIKDTKDFNIRINSIKRIAAQRNFIESALKDFSQDDYIIYSDNDEIPNLESFNPIKINKKIIIFKQEMYYYKFNLKNKGVEWFGSKACKIRDLKSINWLRNIKNRKYKFFRFDTLFSDFKYIDLKIIDNGGWHFTNLKTPEELERKFINDENHFDYDLSKIDINKIKDMMNKQIIKYDHSAKKNSKERFTDKKLEIVNNEELPKFLQLNKEKYINWFV